MSTICADDLIRISDRSGPVVARPAATQRAPRAAGRSAAAERPAPLRYEDFEQRAQDSLSGLLGGQVFPRLP